MRQERNIPNYKGSITILKDAYLESFGKDDTEPNLEQLVDTGAYLRGRILAMESELQVLKNIEAAPE
jgi:hypothetical protein